MTDATPFTPRHCARWLAVPGVRNATAKVCYDTYAHVHVDEMIVIFCAFYNFQ